MGNLIPGGSVRTRFFVDDQGFKRTIDAMGVMPIKLDQNTHNSAAASVTYVRNAAEENFLSDIRRPNEQSSHPERRETGNFTFGPKDSGSAFQGTVFETSKKGLFGFGFPNIQQADSITNFVWRSLEYGLRGTEHEPSALISTSPPFPTGTHVLPRRYFFTTYQPSSAVLVMPKKFARKGPRGQDIHKGGPGKGIPGKHFIERAWLQSLDRINNKWEPDLIDATKAFGRG
jgi:hypothetical protein